MRFAGLQKLTLLDFPGNVACTVFTQGCNLRCPFCHNADLVIPESADSGLSEEYILNFLGSRKGILEGVAVTGGEPLLHKDIKAFLEKVKGLGFKVKLDTNGTRPELLKEIVKEGLADMVAVDIKNSKALYAKTCGIPKLELGGIEESVSFLESGQVDFEFRTTAVKGLHTKESLKELSEWIAGPWKYFLQQFKDSGSLINSNGLEAFSAEEMQALAQEMRGNLPNIQIRGI